MKNFPQFSSKILKTVNVQKHQYLITFCRRTNICCQQIILLKPQEMGFLLKHNGLLTLSVEEMKSKLKKDKKNEIRKIKIS